MVARKANKNRKKVVAKERRKVVVMMVAIEEETRKRESNAREETGNGMNSMVQRLCRALKNFVLFSLPIVTVLFNLGRYFHATHLHACRDVVSKSESGDAVMDSELFLCLLSIYPVSSVNEIVLPRLAAGEY